MVPNRPTISLIIPVRVGTGETAAERSILSLKYPQHLVEVLVVEGSNPSAQRNAAADLATGDILYFIDDDTKLGPRALQILVDAFKDHPDASGIGGPAIPQAAGQPVQQAIKAVLQSVYGTGPMRVRYFPIGELRKSDERKLILCNFAMKKAAWEKHRPFCEHLYPNEENEFFNRLLSSGGSLLYHPFLIAHRLLTVSTGGFVKQMFRYGFGRVRHMKLFANAANLAVLAPLIGLMYFVGLMIYKLPHLTTDLSGAIRHGESKLFSVILVLPLLGYLTLILVGACYTILTSNRRSWKMAANLVFLLPSCHLAYGVGMMASVVTPTRLRHPGAPTLLRQYKLRADIEKEPRKNLPAEALDAFRMVSKHNPGQATNQIISDH